jgi:hypothetical protein
MAIFHLRNCVIDSISFRRSAKIKISSLEEELEMFYSSNQLVSSDVRTITVMDCFIF